MDRTSILRKIYRLFPFNLKGDLIAPLAIPAKNDFISCLICTAQGPGLLRNLLTDIAQQTIDKNQFEVIILDNSPNGLESTAKEFSYLPIQYIRSTCRQGLIGNLRNELLNRAQGAYILFLDDDTRLHQKNFLEISMALFKQSCPDVILPHGRSIDKNTFLDSYSFATRCCLYKRSVLETVGGFHSHLKAYEDIDLGFRLTALGVNILKTQELEYAHPPLFFHSFQKPFAIGQSVLKLRHYYPWFTWLLLYSNALRFLPLGLIPTAKNRQWFKISLGVLIAPFLNKKFTYLP